MKWILICIHLLGFGSLWANSYEDSKVTIDFKSQNDEFWKKYLSPEVYKICRERGTERAFSGKYDKLYESGIYYCACCGGDFPVYSSADKFDSKTGWPSFTKPIGNNSVELKSEDRLFNRLLGAKTEVLCARCGSHLGHVFDDGPPPTGKRYCMNSTALAFVADK